MAIVTRPSGTPPDGIEAQEVRTHEEVDQLIDVEQAAVGLSRSDLDGMRASAHTMFDLRLARHAERVAVSTLLAKRANRSALPAPASSRSASTFPAAQSHRQHETGVSTRL